MAFDREKLLPLYKLEMGLTGESCALHIAKQLGLATHLINRAYQKVYGEMPEKRDNGQDSMKSPTSGLIRAKIKKDTTHITNKFSMGDSVFVLPDNEIGIVYKPANEMGDVIVQIKEEKHAIKHNRLRLNILAAELYPPDYDFSIIFDTVENRKARHRMNRKYDPTVSITYDEHVSE